MTRFMTYVDGSNLFGTLRHLDIDVKDYEKLFALIFERAVEGFCNNSKGAAETGFVHLRVNWYVVDSIDEWDLDDEQSQSTLKEWYLRDSVLRTAFSKEAGETLGEARQEQVDEEAWKLCFASIRDWYERRIESFEGQKRFQHAVSQDMDNLDFHRVGHLKANLIRKTIEEKGIDTALAVDMVAQVNSYDVAVVISGDADSIPSIDYAKRCGKLVAAVEFLKGHPPERKGGGFSSRLKAACDFVIRIYETELLQSGLAAKKSFEADDGPSYQFRARSRRPVGLR